MVQVGHVATSVRVRGSWQAKKRKFPLLPTASSQGLAHRIEGQGPGPVRRSVCVRDLNPAPGSAKGTSPAP